MSPWKAAYAGDHFDTIDTPALVLDLDAFEHNMKRLQDAMSKAGIRLRPHAKSHKCPEIALRQIKAGAIGICCQKVSEAAVFVDAGVDDILIMDSHWEALTPFPIAHESWVARTIFNFS